MRNFNQLSRRESEQTEAQVVKYLSKTKESKQWLQYRDQIIRKNGGRPTWWYRALEELASKKAEEFHCDAAHLL